MHLQLVVTAGPHTGREFIFDRPDSFLVGRAADAHFQLPHDDPYFSRRHFLLEISPPRCRLTDLDSRNGTFVNGVRVQSAELRDGDTIQAGQTAFLIAIPDHIPETALLPAPIPLSSPPTDYPSLPPPFHLPSVPGYALLHELGRGGMGIVYRAKRLADDAEVAVKMLCPDADADPNSVERFLREARILEQLDHPHIVRFLDSGESPGAVFLAMELVAGTTAALLVRDEGPQPIRTAVRLVSQLLKALAHAHALGFVHRDIKPGNVLIEVRPGRRAVKLADFGLARAYAASRLSGLSLNGEVGGTLAFMSPEQITHFRDAQPTTDQYATAATLYVLLTGRTPHDLPQAASEQIAHILSKDPIPVRQRRPDVPEGLAAILHRAMSREVGERYPDVTAFREELNRYAR
jgi:serine/threonine-protein kinase